FRQWHNTNTAYGTHTCSTGRGDNFMFYYSTVAQRKQAMDFLDMIPNGYYVFIRNNASDVPSANVYVDQWKADTTLYGPGNSLYHRLFYAGFYELDSFYIPRAFSFMYKKNDSTFAPKYVYSKTVSDYITLGATCAIPDTVGTITSPQFGPAKKWFDVKWGGYSSESPTSDNPSVSVVGID